MTFQLWHRYWIWLGSLIPALIAILKLHVIAHHGTLLILPCKMHNSAGWITKTSAWRSIIKLGCTLLTGALSFTNIQSVAVFKLGAAATAIGDFFLQCLVIKSNASILSFMSLTYWPFFAHRRSKSTAWDNNFWLDVNYLLAAKAAQNCRAHFTCLLYTEIWCDVQR